MKKIITINRTFGSAGGTIGKKLSDALGFEYYDKEIIIKAARDSNFDLDAISKYDEKAPLQFGFAQSLFDLYAEPLEERFYEAQKKVILALGEHGNCVIVGRNANDILHEFDNSLHVLITADTQWRVKYMHKDKMSSMPESKVLEHLKQIDKAREKFCSYYTKKNLTDAQNYDICLDSSKLGIDTCVKIISDICR